MGTLHDVVLGLPALRVAGQPTRLAQEAEVLAAGEQLVHVGLVPGVEHDRVPRRLEHPVHGDGQLDHTEIGPEVPAGLGDLPYEEGPDLRSELDELFRREVIKISRPGDRVQ